MEVSVSPDLLEFSRANPRRKGHDKRTWQKENTNGPKSPSRRIFLGKMAEFIAAVTVLGSIPADTLPKNKPAPLPPRPEQSEAFDPYRHWELYRNGTLPREHVAAIGRDLAHSPQYPGFPEVGTIIALSLEQPSQLQQYLPQLENHGPIDIKLSNLMARIGALSELFVDTNGVGITATVRHNQTGETKQGGLAKVDRMPLVVNMDNGFASAPDVAKKLIIVKEFSHLLYMNLHQQVIAQTVLQRFEIDLEEPVNLPNLLFINAQASVKIRGIDFGDMYNNAPDDLDGAGYWHIIQALGKMRAMGLLSPTDLVILEGANTAFEEAKRRGLLIEENPGEFVWKEGIGPFSPEWTAMMRPIL